MRSPPWLSLAALASRQWDPRVSFRPPSAGSSQQTPKRALTAGVRISDKAWFHASRNVVRLSMRHAGV